MYILQYRIDHTASVLAYPSIDFIQGSIIKGSLKNARVIIVCIRLQEIFFHCQHAFLVPKPKGIGQLKLAALS